MELDYRQIPYERLDSNIPQGRGMIKWAPFATMPEQYESVNQLIYEQYSLLNLNSQMILYLTTNVQH